MEVKNRRLDDQEFSEERKKVLAMWPTGKEVDLEEAVGYLKAMGPDKNYAAKLTQAKKDGKTLVCSMMGTAPIRQADRVFAIPAERRTD